MFPINTIIDDYEGTLRRNSRACLSIKENSTSLHGFVNNVKLWTDKLSIEGALQEVKITYLYIVWNPSFVSLVPESNAPLHHDNRYSNTYKKRKSPMIWDTIFTLYSRIDVRPQPFFKIHAKKLLYPPSPLLLFDYNWEMNLVKKQGRKGDAKINIKTRNC